MRLTATPRRYGRDISAPASAQDSRDALENPWTGAVVAPECGLRSVNITLEGIAGSDERTVLTIPAIQESFEHALAAPISDPLTVTIELPGIGCAEGEPNPFCRQEERYAGCSFPFPSSRSMEDQPRHSAPKWPFVRLCISCLVKGMAFLGT